MSELYPVDCMHFQLAIRNHFKVLLKMGQLVLYGLNFTKQFWGFLKITNANFMQNYERSYIYDAYVIGFEIGSKPFG